MVGKRLSETRNPESLEEGLIESVSRTGSRYSLTMESGYAFALSARLVDEFGLRRGMLLSVADQEGLIRADQFQTAGSKARTYLGTRRRTTHELRRYLLRTGYGSEVAEVIIAEMTELNYLDDVAYAREIGRSLAERKGYGSRRIAAELQKKGIDRSTSETAVSEIDQDMNMFDLAMGRAERKWRSSANEDPRTRKRRMFGFLSRRGFSADTIRRVVETLESNEA